MYSPAANLPNSNTVPSISTSLSPTLMMVIIPVGTTSSVKSTRPTVTLATSSNVALLNVMLNAGVI